MEQERWPEYIVQLVDNVQCPACSAPRDRVMVTVRYSHPMWHLICNCSACNQMHDTQVLNLFGQLNPKPKVEAVELPAWAKNLEKELSQ